MLNFSGTIFPLTWSLIETTGLSLLERQENIIGKVCGKKFGKRLHKKSLEIQCTGLAISF